MLTEAIIQASIDKMQSMRKSLQYSVGIFHKDYQLTKCI